MPFVPLLQSNDITHDREIQIVQPHEALAILLTSRGRGDSRIVVDANGESGSAGDMAQPHEVAALIISSRGSGDTRVFKDPSGECSSG